MIGPQSSNAKAAFYELEEVEVEDPYGDIVTTTRWVPIDQLVHVRYEPQGSEFVSSETGDRVSRSERLFAPIGVGDRVVEGSPVEVLHRGQSNVWRIHSIRSRTIDGHEGYAQAELENYDDQRADHELHQTMIENGG